MPPLENLAQQSLRDYGLLGTLILLGLIYGIVFLWKRPAEPMVSPMHAVADQAKLLPMILEEVRELGRRGQDHTKKLDDLEHRLERMETIGHIVKDRLDRH